MLDFDAYLMVDWSARNQPKTGKDTVWYCFVKRTGYNLRCIRLANPNTRAEAVTEIREILSESVGRHEATLVGFDFPYGYPHGFASALGLKDRRTPEWHQVWRVLDGMVKDNEKNMSNRFDVAAELNKRISGSNYPFWGCPKRFECKTLSRGKPASRFPTELPVKRLTEERDHRTQPVWKLAYPGSVGSQALLGIPYLYKLRYDKALAQYSKVWPFETGLRHPDPLRKRKWLVLHAEIFPTISEVRPRKGEVKDAAQVRALAYHFARLDESGALSALFVSPDDLGDEDRHIVEGEEGWILGIQ